MELIQQHATQLLILLFLIVTFLLSAIEKVGEWKEQVSFIKNHFKISPFKNYVPILLSILLVMECISVVMMLFGVFYIFTTGNYVIALIGIQICSLSLIFMLIGQRLAKDYQGAMSLGVYFLITIFGMYLLK